MGMNSVAKRFSSRQSMKTLTNNVGFSKILSHSSNVRGNILESRDNNNKFIVGESKIGDGSKI